MRNLKVLLSSMVIASIISCNDDDSNNSKPTEPSSSEGKYVITANPDASEGVADYILTASDLTTGELSISGNGIEQDGTYRYYTVIKDKFFSLLYGQGNPGAVTTYGLDENSNLKKLSNFQSETVQAFGEAGDDLLMIKVSRNADSPYAKWYQVDTEDLLIKSEGQINTQELANTDNNELAFFSWITEFNDNKVLLPYFTIYGTPDDRFGTNHDVGKIAIYNYPSMTLDKVITNEAVSSIGRYFSNGLSKADDGNFYAFSSSIEQKDNKFISNKPTAISRVNSNLEFDDYYFDLDEVSGGAYLGSHTMGKNGKVLLYMEEEKSSPWESGKKLAVVDLYKKTFSWVSGVPNLNTITGATWGGNGYLDTKTNIVHVGINTEEGNYVYQVNLNNAKATKGLKIDGGVISSIKYLPKK